MTGYGTDPRWALAQAHTMLERGSDVTAGRWPRAAALLARQALEEQVARWCSELSPEVAHVSRRAQLLCLSSVVEPGFARDAAHVWSALSNACHHHAYELPPTADELRGWFEVVDRLIATTDADAGPPPAAQDEP